MEKLITHKLMIKRHNITGLRYLCYTRREGKDYDEYTGSGKFWRKHLKKYGEDISTRLIYKTTNYEDFKAYAIKISIKLNIVESNEWANLKIEHGDGGDTVSNKRWITDGKVNKYILKTDELPSGWRYGRSNCVFNDPNKQSEFSGRSDRKKAGKSIKRAWDEGKFDKRDHSKCGTKGDQNPSKRPEVKKKMSDSWIGRDTTNYKIGAQRRAARLHTCEYCEGTFTEREYAMKHGEKCKMKS